MHILHDEVLMRVDWLEDIVALLSSGGVTEAARLRNLTQPAFSRRIRVLEEALEVDLIDRSVKPSGPSRIVRDHEQDLRRIASDLRYLLAEMRNEQESGAQVLIIACQHAISTSLGATIVNRLAEPTRLHIRLRSANLDECDTLLATQQVGITLTYRLPRSYSSKSEAPGFLIEMPIGQEHLIPVCSADRLNAHQADLSRGKLNVIAYPSSVFLGETMSKSVFPSLFDRARVQVVTEVGLTPAALQLALAGLGVAWLPESLARPSLNRGELALMTSDLPVVEMEIIAQRWRTTAISPVLRAWDRLGTIIGTSFG